jgi:hypothetical protein
MKNEMKVGGMKYAVEIVPFVEIGGDRNFAGSCSYQDTTISIMEGLSRERFEEVLLHESFHAILHEAGYDEQDEEVVVRVGKILHTFVKENFPNDFERKVNDIIENAIEQGE